MLSNKENNDDYLLNIIKYRCLNTEQGLLKYNYINMVLHYFDIINYKDDIQDIDVNNKKINISPRYHNDFIELKNTWW